mmetsp:Transcript_114050/g.318526  ORF Transcript_114050/g.318526 Transcript_114050/m.318526 type:complete len:204 (+) Transcript_114050:55-666(+)
MSTPFSNSSEIQASAVSQSSKPVIDFGDNKFPECSRWFSSIMTSANESLAVVFVEGTLGMVDCWERALSEDALRTGNSFSSDHSLAGDVSRSKAFGPLPKKFWKETAFVKPPTVDLDTVPMVLAVEAALVSAPRVSESRGPRNSPGPLLVVGAMDRSEVRRPGNAGFLDVPQGFAKAKTSPGMSQEASNFLRNKDHAATSKVW